MRQFGPCLVLLTCVWFPVSAAARQVADEAAADEPGRAVTTGGLRTARSPFSSLFRAGAIAGAPPAGAAGEPARACEGCPERRVGRAFVEVIGTNALFTLFNAFRNQPGLNPSFESWWANLRYGFEWDYNTFQINQWGHPYQGNLYFNAGRANGLSFWESAPLVAFGSATWEYFGEGHKPSINDFVTTTLGGIALGEMFHRAGWLIRDARLTGRPRMWREILATVVDPITSANRFLSGDASRVSENPPGMKPTSTAGDVEVGLQWNGEINRSAFGSASGSVFAQLRLGYNDIFGSPFKQPYDAFAFELRLGGGAGISEATVRGRLYGRFLGEPSQRPTQFLVAQGYDYQRNDVFEYGGQSVVVGLSHRFRSSDATDVAVFGVGGPILLGAISSPVAVEPQDGDTEAPERAYDFGPGAQVAGGLVFSVRGHRVANLSYTSFYIHTVSAVEGASGEHYAQVLRFSLMAPLWRGYRIGFSADYINRATYFETAPDVHQWIPQVRVFLARVSR